jgi:hypothetical protein
MAITSIVVDVPHLNSDSMPRLAVERNVTSQGLWTVL